MNCPECGYLDDRTLHFCPKCGHDYYGKEHHETTNQTDQLTQSNIPIGGQRNDPKTTNELFFANQITEIKKLAEEQRNDIHTIKNIAVFYLVVSILGIVAYGFVFLLALVAS